LRINHQVIATTTKAPKPLNRLDRRLWVAPTRPEFSLWKFDHAVNRWMLLDCRRPPVFNNPINNSLWKGLSQRPKQWNRSAHIAERAWAHNEDAPGNRPHRNNE
jgi:hypothetical protein